MSETSSTDLELAQNQSFIDQVEIDSFTDKESAQEIRNRLAEADSKETGDVTLTISTTDGLAGVDFDSERRLQENQGLAGVSPPPNANATTLSSLLGQNVVPENPSPF